MQQTPSIRVGLAIVFTLILGCAKPNASMPQKNAAVGTEGQVHLDNLRPENIIGHLGFPLGTIVTIEGIVEDLNDSNAKADDGRTSLKIHTVNGQPLAKPFHYDFYPAEVKKGRFSTPPANVEFKYVGYEVANFYGHPAEAEKYWPRIPPVATNRFGFRCEGRFVFLDDLLYLVKSKPEPDHGSGPLPSY